MASREHGGVPTATQRAGDRSSNGEHMEEFTVPTSRETVVNEVTKKLEQIFMVSVVLVTTPADNFSWVKVTGKSQENVQRAKEFVVGLCGEALRTEQDFPPGLQCVFEGLGGRFLHALAWDSRADVSVAGEGRLVIRGGAEAVLLAQSRVQHFCDCCRETDAPAGAAAFAPGGGDPPVKRRFNRLVEENGGRYGTELLLLPPSIKRDLLELLDAKGAHCGGTAGVSSGSFVLSPRGADATDAPGRGGVAGGGIRVTMPTQAERMPRKGAECLPREENGSPVTELSSNFTSALGKAAPETPDADESAEGVGAAFQALKKPSAKRKTSDSEAAVSGQMKRHSPANEGSSRRLGEEPERELKYLVNFFSTMGYSPELVRSVVLEIGQKTEASEILDRLQAKAALGSAAAAADEDEDGRNGREAPQDGSYAMHCVMEAAVSLGYSRDEVGDVCRAVGTDPRSVLDELHRVGDRAPASAAAATGRRAPAGPLPRVASRGDCGGAARKGGSVPLARLPSDDDDDDVETDCAGPAPPPPRAGPGNRECVVISDDDDTCVAGAGDDAPREEATRCRADWRGPQQPCAASTSVSRAESFPPAAAAAAATATGSSGTNLQPSELFLLGLSKPHKLRLPNEPGKDSVRHVVVDGSNVAMAHGINRYFSCRGIALCVEYFWRRGHRNITVFVPQYRTCRDPAIKEQHLLSQLEELGLLSFTPCRVVEGRRIATHDDRFMLHLAENTDGIIVTNDNFREFPKESLAWRDIVRQRILPFTFAGDMFMVPDDPLGRHGPRLDEFLAKPTSARLPRHDPTAYKAHTLGHGPRPIRGPFGSAAATAATFASRSMSDRPHAPWPGWTHLKHDLQDVRRQLLDIFPGEEDKVQRVMQQNPAVVDLNQLSDFMLDV